ncbi:hypothetical protein [Ferrimicrobium sp.]|uniref:hypothetical protein n=1 Tax=Ferrimicrobium sp. TaxID=2926050 RepID=UPI00262319BE|nr:hypothetical protein [Ferrimicrobium sp.]
MGKIGQGIQAGIGILVLAGGVGAFYVFNHDPALKQRLLQDVGAEDKPAPQPPANAPVGFNAARTAFVLPHKLGYLPAPELALAKSDPAYAAGLANLGDWYRFVAAPVMAGGPSRTRWEYIAGLPRNAGLAAMKAGLVGFPPTGIAAIRAQVMTTQVSIRDFTLHVLSQNAGNTTGYGVGAVIPEYVVPTGVEIAAAPVGMASMGGVYQPVVCVPSPLAYLQNGHIFSPWELPRITAGPSTMFGTATSGGTLIQGVASCIGFA